jgi:hypothetical protein
MLGGAPGAAAQSLADFDYTNLSFRGVGVEVGRIWADKVVSAPTVGLRADLGYLGPGVRITPSLTWWSSHMKQGEVTSLETRLASLIQGQQGPGAPPPSVALGRIDWSDLAFDLDAHVVWRTPYNVLTFAGGGASVHALNGSGNAIDGTFVEDLLDSVSAGLDVHAGAEYALHPRVRIYALGRFELLQDIKYAALRGGLQLQLGPSAPGEEKPR